MRTLFFLGLTAASLLMGAPSLRAQDAGCAPGPPGRVAWWRGEGDATDSQSGSQSGLDGSTIGNPQYVDGRVGKAFSLNGSADGITVPNSAGWRFQSVTVDGWFRFSAIPGVAVLFAKTYGSTAEAPAAFYWNGNLWAGGGNTWITIPWSPALGQWYHVALTYDYPTGKQRLYVDGQLRGENVLAGGYAYDDHPFTIGTEYENGSPAFFFPGSIDEVSVYARALTADEVSAVYQAGLAGQCLSSPPMPDPPVAYNTLAISREVSFAVTGDLANNPTMAVSREVSLAITNDLVNSPTLAVSRQISVALHTNPAPDARIFSGPYYGQTVCASSVDFVWTGSDDVTPYDQLQYSYQVDDGPWSPFSHERQATLTGLAPGQHSVAVRALDTDGNTGGASLSSFTVASSPVMDQPADIQTQPVRGRCDADVVVTAPSASSPCGGYVAVAGVRSDGEALTAPYPLGETTIAWTATDSTGRTTTAQQKVIVGTSEPNRLYGWGYNKEGELGDGTEINRLEPVMISLPSGVAPTRVAAGGFHSLAIGADNRLYTWGWNGNGQLGDGTTTDRTTPNSVGLPSGVTPLAIEAGHDYSLMTGSDGKLYAWGRNDFGQLGDGSWTERHSPVVVAFPAGVTPITVSAGYEHSLAIGSDNRLYAWGANYANHLGDGTTNSRTSPVVISLSPGVWPTAVAAGGGHSLAIGTDGRLYAWGENGYGAIGDGGSATHRSTPVVVSLPSSVTPVAVAAGMHHSVAIGSDHQLYEWGARFSDGVKTSQLTPIQVPLPTGVTPVAVAAGMEQTLVKGSDNQVYAWGWNSQGELGDGTTTTRPTPVRVHLEAGLTPFAMTGGDFHSLVLTGSGSSFLPVAWVSLNTAAPTTSSTLTASVAGCDAEGSTLTYTYVWKRNGTVVKTTQATTATVDSLDLGAVGALDGDTITVIVTPNDGKVDGASDTATATVISRFTMADAMRALKIAAGIVTAQTGDARLNVEDPAHSPTDLRDALRLARKAGGKEPNP